MMRSILTSIPEPVQRLALALESVHHVGGHDGLPLGVLGVGHRVPHHVLQEHAQHRADLKQECTSGENFTQHHVRGTIL